MKVIAFTDLHGNVTQFQLLDKEISAADLIILAGDITHFGRQDEVRQILQILMSFGKKILAVHGNCDFPEVLKEIQNENISVHGRLAELNNVQFLGLGGSIPCPGDTPSEYSEEELERILDNAHMQLKKDTDFVLIAHQPPLNTINDTIPGGRHVGSQAVRNFIEKYQPIACITGHIHEGIGIDRIGRTVIVNPGPFRSGNYTTFTLDGDIKGIELKHIKTSI